jgi:hypothetical protein
MNNRGFTVIDATELFNIHAKDKRGNRHQVKIDNKYIGLSYLDKLMMYEKCPPVLGVVTSRANRMSTLDYSVVPIRQDEDEIYSDLKIHKEIFEENSQGNLFSLGKRIRAYHEIRKYLTDVFPDLSNFDASLKRWARSIKIQTGHSAAEIEDFFARPNPNMLWSEFIKIITQDLLVHGAVSIYKANSNLYILPGGSVYPIKSKYVGGPSGFVQIPLYGDQPQLFFSDELAYAQYMPNSNKTLGICPLEALTNLVAENLLFSELMASRADGSESPKKIIVFGEPQSTGEAQDNDATSVPIDTDEQIRMEKLLNKEQKNKAVKIITGYGTPAILDLSKADTIPTQLERQNKIDQYVAMVFNASNAEINQTGGDGTSGRSTSESQERADNSKGIFPFVRIIEELFTHQIIPYKFGYGWRMKFEQPMSTQEKIDISTKKVQSGLFDVNEVRVEDWNKEAYPEPQYDRPQTAQPQQPASANDIASLLNQR